MKAKPTEKQKNLRVMRQALKAQKKKYGCTYREDLRQLDTRAEYREYIETLKRL